MLEVQADDAERVGGFWDGAVEFLLLDPGVNNPPKNEPKEFVSFAASEFAFVSVGCQSEAVLNAMEGCAMEGCELGLAAIDAVFELEGLRPIPASL